MFKKPFKIKSQIQLKSTEKKKFGNDLQILFPSLRDEDISSLISSKENIVLTKITTFKEEEIEIYCINKIPMYLDVIDTNVKLPTVFLLWRFPRMLPTFTTTNSVLSKLKNGADLFFPGIYKEGLYFCDMDYKKNDPVYVNLEDNKAAVAVGTCLVDRDNVMDSNQHKSLGKLVKIYHVVGDYLFKMNNDAVVLKLGPPDWALPVNEGLQQYGDPTVQAAKNINNIVERAKNLEVTSIEKTADQGSAEVKECIMEAEKETPDELLEYCFLKALKTVPKTSYPILPATFYANHVLSSLPEGREFNIKKTKWKKFSTFLQEKSIEGLIHLQQMPKNEFMLTGAKTDHKRLKEFVDPYRVISVEVESKGDNKPTVQQVFSVSAATLPFFAKFGYKKHDELTRNEVRNYLNDYIKSENLIHPENPELVTLNFILHDILKGNEVVTRAYLLTTILSKMSVQHKVSNCGNEETILHKGKMPLIEFEICMRMGNKKVTLISNVECYGVNTNNFSKELQHKAAASTTITPIVPGKKGPQVQVQGNQIHAAVAILTEKYNINEKFMKGLEKAVKPKHKK